MPAAAPTFPLVPRRRLIGLSFGAMHSARRGIGSDIAGSRQYRPGDDIDTIDWAASAKLSAVRGTDEFIVREHYADESPNVVVLCDRSRAMRGMPDEWGWFSKARASAIALHLIADSALAARGMIGYLDFAQAEPRWLPPRSRFDAAASGADDGLFGAAADTLNRGVEHLVRHRRTFGAGSFLFLVSDFLHPLSAETWTAMAGQRWDIVPVVVQDPVWEQSFPDVHSLAVPLQDEVSGKGRRVRLSKRECLELRARHERRFAALLSTLRRHGAEPVVISRSDRASVLGAFLEWADRRRAVRHGGLG
jgi:uncharacterized protein (DUF58 family)